MKNNLSGPKRVGMLLSESECAFLVEGLELLRIENRLLEGESFNGLLGRVYAAWLTAAKANEVSRKVTK